MFKHTPDQCEWFLRRRVSKREPRPAHRDAFFASSVSASFSRDCGGLVT